MADWLVGSAPRPWPRPWPRLTSQPRAGTLGWLPGWPAGGGGPAGNFPEQIKKTSLFLGES